jgi:hypothetical protein
MRASSCSAGLERQLAAGGAVPDAIDRAHRVLAEARQDLVPPVDLLPRLHVV